MAAPSHGSSFRDVPGKIVIGIQGAADASRDALALAIDLARGRSPELVLVRVWVSPLGPGQGHYDRALKADAERELRLAVEGVPDAIPVRTDVRGSTSILRGLHAAVEDHKAELLVLGPSHLGRAARSLRGDFALGVLHDAPCTVAVAPPGYRLGHDQHDDVVVGWIDGPEADAALETAVDLAAGTGGTLRIVTVLETPYEFLEAPSVDSQGHRWLRSLRSDARDCLARGVRLVAGRVPVETQLREGYVDEELSLAADGAGFIVTGSRGYGAVRRMVVGSTTAALLRHARVPVIVVASPVADRRAAKLDAVA